MSVRTVTAALVAVAVLAGSGLVASPAGAVTKAETKFGNKLFAGVNSVRVDNDRAALKRSKCLQRFANKQAQAMANQERLFHQDLGRIQDACHVGWVGENVVGGSGTPPTFVQAWMTSPPHRANILNRHFRITGVAARRGGGQWWAAQVFGRTV